MLKPLRYMDTTVRFNVGPLLSLVTKEVASKILGPLTTLGTIESELLASLIIVTGSPALSFSSFTHFFWKRQNVGRPSGILDLSHFIIFNRLQYRYLDISRIWVLCVVICRHHIDTHTLYRSLASRAGIARDNIVHTVSYVTGMI